MSGLELIIAALAAGATAGVAGSAKAAVGDTYDALKGHLIRRLADRPRAAEVIASGETKVDFLDQNLSQDLIECGATSDEIVLEMASRLLGQIQNQTSFSNTINNVSKNNGAVGTFNGPITISSGPHPPSGPTVD